MKLLISLAAFSAAGLLAPGCAALASAPVEENWVQTSDGVLLSYRKIGAGEEVVLVPGLSWVAADMGDLAKGRTVIFYDPRGRGRSDARPTIDVERDLSDLEEVRAWFGLERFMLLGTDYHGALAAKYALRNPQRVTGLVLVSPLPLSKFPHWKIYTRVYAERQDERAVEALNAMKRDGIPRKDPEGWADAYGRLLMESWVRDPASIRGMKSKIFVVPNLDPELQISRYFEMLQSWGDWDWRAAMADIACPTLVVYGDSDPMPLQASEEWGAVVPRASVHVVPRSGRLPWLENPRSFFGAVNDFLQ